MQLFIQSPHLFAISSCQCNIIELLFCCCCNGSYPSFFPENEMCLLLSLYVIHGRAYIRFNLIKFRNEVYASIFSFLSWSVSIFMFSSHFAFYCLILCLPFPSLPFHSLLVLFFLFFSSILTNMKKKKNMLNFAWFDDNQNYIWLPKF